MFFGGHAGWPARRVRDLISLHPMAQRLDANAEPGGHLRDDPKESQSSLGFVRLVPIQIARSRSSGGYLLEGFFDLLVITPSLSTR